MSSVYTQIAKKRTEQSKLASLPSQSESDKKIETATKPKITSKPENQPTKELPKKRPYIRRTFDFYEDQITYLTTASLEERLAGQASSMNAMIREAIDRWIKERTSKK